MKPSLAHLSVVSARRTLCGGSASLHQTIARLSGLMAAPTLTRRELPEAQRRAEQSSRHARDVLVFLRAMATALDEVSKLLDRAWSLSQQAQAITTTDLDRLSQDAAYQSILVSLQHLTTTATFNGEPLFGPVALRLSLDGGPVPLDMDPLGLGLGGDVKTPGSAHAVTRGVHTARNRVAHRRTTLKDHLDRLAHLASTHSVRAQTLACAKRGLHDAHLADEVLNLAKLQSLSRQDTDLRSPS